MKNEEKGMKRIVWCPKKLENGKWNLGYPGCSFGELKKQEIHVIVSGNKCSKADTVWNWSSEATSKGNHNVVVQWNTESNDDIFSRRMFDTVCTMLTKGAYEPIPLYNSNAVVSTMFTHVGRKGQYRFTCCYPFPDVEHHMSKLTIRILDLIDIEVAKYEHLNDTDNTIFTFVPDVLSKRTS